MTTIQITPANLSSVLDGLFGCEKSTTQIEPPAAILAPRVVATYNDVEGEFKFAIVCDLPLANSMGAALTMIPPGGVEDATAAGEVPNNVGDNLYEVFNICSAVFADVYHHRILLDKFLKPGDELDDELIQRIETGECLLQVNYALDRYRAGVISLIRVA